jgi:hypothetical protein
MPPLLGHLRATRGQTLYLGTRPPFSFLPSAARKNPRGAGGGGPSFTWCMEICAVRRPPW